MILFLRLQMHFDFLFLPSKFAVYRHCLSRSSVSLRRSDILSTVTAWIALVSGNLAIGMPPPPTPNARLPSSPTTPQTLRYSCFGLGHHYQCGTLYYFHSRKAYQHNCQRQARTETACETCPHDCQPRSRRDSLWNMSNVHWQLTPTNKRSLRIARASDWYKFFLCFYFSHFIMIRWLSFSNGRETVSFPSDYTWELIIDHVLPLPHPSLSLSLSVMQIHFGPLSASSWSGQPSPHTHRSVLEMCVCVESFCICPFPPVKSRPPPPPPPPFPHKKNNHRFWQHF